VTSSSKRREKVDLDVQDRQVPVHAAAARRGGVWSPRSADERRGCTGGYGRRRAGAAGGRAAWRAVSVRGPQLAEPAGAGGRDLWAGGRRDRCVWPPCDRDL